MIAPPGILTPLLSCVLISIAGCRDPITASGQKAVIQPSTRPTLTLDPAKPFVIELGRGSGWHGLDIITLDQSGAVQLTRFENRPTAPDQATLQLSPSQLKQLLDSASATQLGSLAASYSDPGTADGGQWILSVRQGAIERTTYFNNAFPSQINTFAAQFDAILTTAGLPTATWTPIPVPQATAQQKALWDRIK